MSIATSGISDGIRAIGRTIRADAKATGQFLRSGTGQRILGIGSGAVALGTAYVAWGQSPKTRTEKVGTAISHSAMLSLALIRSKGSIRRGMALGSLVGSVSGTMLNAGIKGSDADAPKPRPGNALDDIVGEARRRFKRDGKRDLLLWGGIGGAIAGGGALLLTRNVKIAAYAGLGVGGAAGAIGGAQGAMRGLANGFWDGSGIAIGRGIDAVLANRDEKS